MSKLFNIYVSEVKEDIMSFDFTIPEFFDKHKFRINKELIPNKLTRDYLEEDKKLEYIFKIILGSFSTKKKKAIGVFSDSTIDIFNRFVDKISLTIDQFMNKSTEKELTKDQLIDFSKWFDLKIDKDGEDNVYPDVWQEIVSKTTDKKEKAKSKDIKK
jgi:hypothetical protein